MSRRAQYAAVVAAALALAACTSHGTPRSTVPPLAGAEPNGEQARTGTQLLADARTAVGRAASVHLTGSLVLGGVATTVDLTAAHDGELSGSVGGLGGSLQLQVSGGVLYVRPTGKAGPVATRLGLPSAVAAPSKGNAFWQLDPATAPGVTALAQPSLAVALVPDSLVAAAGLGSGDVDGTPVVTASVASGSVSVAVTGDVRLVRLVGGAAGPSGLDVDSETVTAPPLNTPAATPAPGYAPSASPSP